MNRRKKLVLNVTFGIGCQLVSLICSFILPRFFLVYYGSEVNGLIATISQYLSLITVLDLGVGTVVQSALYEPLACGDSIGISRIVASSNRFFKKIAMIMIIYIIFLIFSFDTLVKNNFEFMYTSELIIAISISLFAQYYFGVTNQILLNADQKSYIQLITQIVTIVLNTILCIILIMLGGTIQVVKLTTSFVFLIRPIVFYFYVKKHYGIKKVNIGTEEPITQKWNGISQHLAYTITMNSSTIILSFFTDLTIVSIFTIYNTIVNGVNQVLRSFQNGIPALFGNLIANKEFQKLESYFNIFEWIIHNIIILLFMLCNILIIPFINIYTKGINDTNYIIPFFANVFILAQAIYALRTPYQMLVLAAGHYRETQNSAIIECILNILCCTILVIVLEINGLAIGMLLSMLYRTLYFIYYSNKRIMMRGIHYYIKYIILDVVFVLLARKFCSGLYNNMSSYIIWFKYAVIQGIKCLAILIILNICFFNKQSIVFIKGLKGKIKNK